MLLKQKSLFLIFVAYVIIGATGYVMEDGKSPPKTLKSWLPEKELSRLKGRSQSGYIAQRAQRRNSYAPVRQQARPTYFDSHSHKRTQAANPDAQLFRQAQRRQRVMNLPNEARGTFQDSSLFQQIEKERNFVSLFRDRPQSRTPFERHEMIDAHSPISKREREQHLFWGNSNENYGPDINREVESVRFGGEGIQDNLHHEYQRNFFRGEDIKSYPVNRRQSNRDKRRRDHFFMQQNPARVNDHEFDDNEPDYFVGESDYSHEITYEGDEEEIRYESPFTDEGASNDQIEEHYDFFGNQEAFKDNVQYHSSEVEGNQEAFKDNVRYHSLEVEGNQETNIIHPADFEVDFSSNPDFSVEETHVKDTSVFSEEIKPSRLSLDSFEVGFDNSFTNKKNPVRSLEAVESQEYNKNPVRSLEAVESQEYNKKNPVRSLEAVESHEYNKKNPVRSLEAVESHEYNNKKIKTIYRVSRGKDKGGIYPVITSVHSNIEDIATSERKGRNLQVSTQPSGDEETPSSKQNRRGLEVGPFEGLQDSKYSQQIESNQNKGKRTARHIQHHRVPGYTQHGAEHVHLTNAVPTYYPNVPKEKFIVIKNPPEVHQTVEVHHQHVPHYPDESIVSIQSPPGAFVEVPQYDPDVHDLPHIVNPLQHQPYLEVNFSKHVKVRKIRKGYIYEIHLTEEEHLHQNKNVYDHYPPGHHSR